MKTLLIFCLFAGLFFLPVIAQVSINTDGTAPDPSAGLDVKFTDRGILFPRLTYSQIVAIPDPANGLVVFCTGDSRFYAYIANESKWKEISFGSVTIPFTCGTALTVNHVAGPVAPVTKTVTYGTVNNIPGEPSRCWITRNLGASQQAGSCNDGTEASAGWYWQFDRKQGFKHDGATRTPGYWNSSASGSAEWQAINDPCAIELGGAWRLPTYAEYSNVMNAGGWVNWYGPWNSDLKMHAAGYLEWPDGSLSMRGQTGSYWSRTSLNQIDGYSLYFNNNQLFMNYTYQPYGSPLRCISE